MTWTPERVERRKKARRSEEAQARQQEAYRGNTWSVIGKLGGSRISAEDIAKLKLAIPDDTRTITGIVFGDPLPGRSALDRRNTA